MFKVSRKPSLLILRLIRFGTRNHSDAEIVLASVEVVLPEHT